jgi:PKD repeat protein
MEAVLRLRIGLFCIVLSSFQAFAGTTITPTTTLAAETGNNTSAASTFQAQTNGNVAPGNVSKVPTSTLLYNGSTTAIYAHFMPWFGTSYHMNVGYDSNDPAEVKKQVTDILSRGIAGVVIDWYGAGNTQHNATALAVMNEAQTRNGAFQFGIMEDAGAISSCANTSGCDITAALISDLNYITQTFIPSPDYIRWNGNPVIFYFGVESYNIDWTRVRANTASGLVFVFENTGGFTHSYSNAAFAWVQPSNVTATDPMALSYLTSFYTVAEQTPSKLPVGAAYKGFNDSLASWGSKRLMQQQCGQTWLATFKNANSMWSSTNQLAWFQLVTWNDYEEATEIETGIDNCVSVSASVSGSTLNWSITGDESTIDHYTAFISSDGQNLMSLGDFPAGTRTLDLSTSGFNPGTYSVFVKAVGKPSLLNHMSAAATYTSGPYGGPVVALTANPTSGVAPVTVAASTTGSSDASGTITSSSIDFGDGTVMSGPSASHTYSTAGMYTLKATLTDNAGVTASRSVPIVVTASQPPVAQISVSPASGTAPLTVTASAASSSDPQGSALTSSISFGDGTTAAGPTASHSYANAGTYTVTATVTNALKLQSQASATVTVNGAVTLNVLQPANNSTVAAPIHVVANGSAPSGVDALQIYLDHTLVYQINASSFDTTVAAGPGTHLVVVKLWDKLGNAYMQSRNVTVANSFATSLTVTPTAINAGASVTATVTATSGTMSSSQITWGDGTTSAGAGASHVYSTAGNYTVTSTATSNTGTTSQATAAVTVSAPAATLTVSQPTNNANTHSPITVIASGSAPSGVSAMQIYLDGVLTYQVNASSFSTTVPASAGTHAILVKLWDKLGNASSRSQTVNVLPALVTSLSLSSSTISAGGSVTASLNASSGTIASSTIKWGDGGSSSGPSAAHTYASAGTYTITGTASDVVGPAQPATASLIVQSGAFVVLQSPAPNSTVPQSLHVTGYSSSPIGIVAMQIYLDGVKVYQNSLNQVDTYINLAVGTHRITLKAWDTAGASYMKAEYVTAQ